MINLAPGQRVYFCLHGNSRKLAAEGPALILTVHPRTAHIRYRRGDGRIMQRWIKRTRLEIAHAS